LRIERPAGAATAAAEVSMNLTLGPSAPLAGWRSGCGARLSGGPI